MDETIQVANVLLETAKKLRMQSLPEKEYWSSMAKAAIERLDIIRNLTNANPTHNSDGTNG